MKTLYRNEIYDELQKYKRISMKEFQRRFCGKKIGSGCSRNVYIFKPNKRYVVKIAPTWGKRDNFSEYITWSTNWLTPLQKLLAPCIWISDSGRILIQRRVRHVRRTKYPDRLPSCFADHKFSNYGWIGKRFVCCDYASLYFNLPRPKKVKWWEVRRVNGKLTIDYKP